MSTQHIITTTATTAMPGGPRERFFFLEEACNGANLARILEHLTGYPGSIYSILAACGVSRGWRLAGVGTMAYEASLCQDLGAGLRQCWLMEDSAVTVLGVGVNSEQPAPPAASGGSRAGPGPGGSPSRLGCGFPGREVLYTAAHC